MLEKDIDEEEDEEEGDVIRMLRFAGNTQKLVLGH